MRNTELQAMHDEIWRQIFHRQKRTLELKLGDESCLDDAATHNLCSNQFLFGTEDGFSESESQVYPEIY